MNRRTFIKASIVSGVTIVGVGGGSLLLIDGTNQDELTIDLALKKLDVLSTLNNESLIHLGEWDPYQIFTHCAQSVEFSMSKFPIHKSSFFKNTLGKLAFSIFSHKGKMTHGLNEPIPGAPTLSSKTNTSDFKKALNRLKEALMAFDKYQGDIAPHFAYGELTKKEFEMAHVLHLYNHLQEIMT